MARQLGPLERQSETARVYLKKKEALKHLDIQMFLVEMGRIRSQMQQVDEKYSIAQGDLEETCKNFETTKAEYDRLETQLAQLEEEIQTARDEATKKALQQQNLENQIHILEEQIHSARQNDAQYQERSLTLGEDIEKRILEAEDCQKEKMNFPKSCRSFRKTREKSRKPFRMRLWRYTVWRRRWRMERMRLLRFSISGLPPKESCSAMTPCWNRFPSGKWN